MSEIYGIFLQHLFSDRNGALIISPHQQLIEIPFLSVGLIGLIVL